MTNPHVDELCMMTYLSQFLEAKVQDEGILYDISPILNSKVMEPTKVKMSGAGITGEGAKVGVPASVIVDCQESASMAPLVVQVTKPSGEVVSVFLEPSASNNKVLEGAYNPNEPGNYTVEVTFDGQPLPDSPYNAAIGDPLAVHVDSLDLAIVGEDSIIDVYTDKAGPGNVDIGITSPLDASPVKPSIRKVGNHHYQVSYKPEKPGLYQAAVKFNNASITDIFINAIDPSMVQIIGPDVVREGSKDMPAITIAINCKASGLVPMAVTVSSPSGLVSSIPLLPQTAEEPRVLEGIYWPEEYGYHSIGVAYRDRDLCESPYKVLVSEPIKVPSKDASAVILGGEGLEKAIVQEVNIIDVFTNATGPGDISVEFIGPPGIPMQATVVFIDDSHYQVHYTPKQAGLYRANIKYDNVPVRDVPCRITAINRSSGERSGIGLVILLGFAILILSSFSTNN